MSTNLTAPVGPGGYPVELSTDEGRAMVVVLDATNEASFTRLWGMTLLERNLRLVERLGAQAVVVATGAEQEARARKRRFQGLLEPCIHSAEAPLTWASALRLVEEAGGPTLLLEAHGVYDRRFLALLWQAGAPATGEMGGDPLSAAALFLTPATVEQVPSDGQLPWTHAAHNSPAIVERIDLERIAAHDSDMRKAVPPAALAVVDGDSRRRADRYLANLAGKGINDIVGEFIHPPIEFALTRLCALTPITPNQISYLNIILSLAAVPMFFAGNLWEGIAINLVRGVTDGVDGKLARLTLRESEGGNVLDHGLDTLYLPLLFAAFGYHLAAGDPYSAPAVASYLLQGFYWPNRVFSSWYKTFLRVAESDFRRSDRIVRRFHPKRNIFILMMIVATALGTPTMALYGITALTGFMFVFRIARLDREGRRLVRERARLANSVG